jgi:hypothetical protein
MKNFQCIYATVIRGKTSTKLILVHNSSSIYNFLEYMSGKIYFYPGNKAPGKVNLVSSLVIINVTRTQCNIFLEKKHNAIKK